jgi:hypothetical protein
MFGANKSPRSVELHLSLNGGIGGIATHSDRVESLRPGLSLRFRRRLESSTVSQDEGVPFARRGGLPSELGASWVNQHGGETQDVD